MFTALPTRSSGQAIHRLGANSPHPHVGTDKKARGPCQSGDEPGESRQPGIPGAIPGSEPVGEPAAAEHANGSADQKKRREKLAGGDEIQAEAAHHHRRCPRCEGVADQ